MRQIDLRALALDTFYHAGNLSQESETQYERAIGFKAGDNVERSGVPGAIYKVLKINDNGSATIRMFLDAENWDGPTTVVSYDNVRAGKLKKTDKAPRRRAKDEMKRHKFQPMPPNTRGAKSCLCNKCLEHRSHTNHYTDDTKLEKMKDTKAKDQVPQDCFDAQILGV